MVARQRLDALRANRGDTLSGLQGVARAEAALGHPDRAVALSRQLSAAGRHRAAIALYAALGDTLATMETFRILWDRGVLPFREYNNYHRGAVGILLRDYPAFRELTRVRD